MRVRPLLAGAIYVALIGCSSVAWAQANRPVRMFPEFTGTWVLDEAASTGPLVITPRIPSRMTITTTPSEITVAKQLRLDPRDKISDTPEPEVYRFDGTETTINRRHFSFRLVADALALTEKYSSVNGSGSFTLTTDAYSLAGDVLTVHRQLSSITPEGHILVMQVPGNNFRHTYIYRREAPGNR
jgi:hypothetical protein